MGCALARSVPLIAIALMLFLLLQFVLLIPALIVYSLYLYVVQTIAPKGLESSDQTSVQVEQITSQRNQVLFGRKGSKEQQL